MTKQQLVELRGAIEQQFNNLCDPHWVATQVEHLKAKHEVLGQLLDEMEKEDAANNSAEQPKSGQSSKRK